MIANAGSWASYFGEVHVQALQRFRTAALERVIPAFSGIEEEAQAAAEAEYERLGSMPADPDRLLDLADLADWATEHGAEYHETMSGLRQSVLNLLAVGLHHLFEQQQLFFLDRALAGAQGGSRRLSQFESRLRTHSVDPQTFECASKVNELRLAANTIKHGVGPSADKLAKVRPDLFEPPTDVQDRKAQLDAANSERAAMLASSFLAPLAGRDLCVCERDISAWCDAAISYWKELSAVLNEHQLRSQ
ncbi:MAG: hypothetical protein OXP36_07565 [Gammaproteobacteria bacterium]|nr:hypothetical protein [Gammaproteobacteria bacterium]